MKIIGRIEIDVAEVDAELLLSPKRWDDKWNRIEDCSAEEFEAMLEKAKGKTVFNVRVKVGRKQAVFCGPPVYPPERGMALENVVEMAIRVSAAELIRHGNKTPQERFGEVWEPVIDNV